MISAMASPTFIAASSRPGPRRAASAVAAVAAFFRRQPSRLPERLATGPPRRAKPGSPAAARRHTLAPGCPRPGGEAMPPTKATEAEFAALLRRAGLSLTPEQRAGVHAVWGAVEEMLDRIRTPAPGTAPGSAEAASAEPAVVFRAEKGRGA